MKVKLQQDPHKAETEVTISYEKMDSRLHRMIGIIRQYEYTICGTIENRIFEIPLDEILYFDCTEGRTFFYTKENTYECEKNLITLEQELNQTSVLRVQKNCLMNTQHLECVSPYPNHRLLAEMSNGEKIIISRKYIPNLHELGKRGAL
ncbi:MAG: LytTR family DNA-binding domain-containing protein [bacterium]|nr:LytTR family DNA-binding domain-containing protein [bacterium]